MVRLRSLSIALSFILVGSWLSTDSTDVFVFMVRVVYDSEVVFVEVVYEFDHFVLGRWFLFHMYVYHDGRYAIIYLS